MKHPALLLLVVLLAGCTAKEEPFISQVLPIPSASQLAWQQMEMNMFIHFNMNTFTNMEWGFGDESPSQFNPTDLDCRQWAKIAKAAGMEGIILTAKHHDGFCLWPSAYTEHSVKNSPWKNGEGDVVQELREACEEYGLKMGLYLSPWDRNHPEYGQPTYIEYYRNQMVELLSNYGDIFEFWVDGANGGDGYYGGANETRKVDRQSYYDWDSTFALATQLQPDVVIFSDAGPGCRWVGNEEGWANPTNWSTLNKEGFYPGTPDYKELTSGHEGGTSWVPAEVNTSIRPGWYYHPEEDTAVKSLEKLQAIYDHSLGRNGLLLLNMPVDTRGQIHPNDSARLLDLATWVEVDQRPEDRIIGTIQATHSLGEEFAADQLLDGSDSTCWSVEGQAEKPSVELTFDSAKEIRLITIEEAIRFGQRVAEFSVEVKMDGQWSTLHEETTIGYQRMLRNEPVTAEAIRLTILRSRGPVVLSELAVY